MGKPLIDSDAQHRRMLETPIPRLVAALAIPTTATQLITVAYNAADTYFVSQIGTSASAAVGVVFSLMSIIQAFGFGIGMGTNSLVSLRLGAQQDEEAHRYASSAFCASLIVGLALLTGGLLLLEPLMKLLGSTPTMLPYACDYARYILLGAPVMCASFVLSSVLRAEGEANLAMWGLCAGGLLNLALDPLFIFTFGLGISGAAIATMLGQLASFLILLVSFLRGRSIVKISPRYISKKAADYFMIVRVGFPTICRQGMASLSSALLNTSAALYGDAAVAAITVANRIYLLVRGVIIGVGQGFQPVAGYNFGAGNKRRVRQAFWYATALGTGICLCAAAPLALFAPQVIAWFRNDPDVIRIGTLALYFACAVMPFMAYSTFVNQLYQCLGFSGRATFLACCRQGVFFLPLIVLLPRLFGLTGVQATQPAADFLTFLICVPFQALFFRRTLQDGAPVSSQAPAAAAPDMP